MADMLPSLLSDVSAEIIVGLLGALVLSLWSQRSNFTRLRRYKASLHQQLKAMPFIYKDLDGEVLNDFVDIEVQVLDTKTRQTKPSTPRRTSRDELIRQSRRVIFLGDAGIGKTTYQRYAILSILNSGRSSPFTYSDEDCVPVYVPLKLVDTSSHTPISDFVLNKSGLFSGPAGTRFFRKLCRKRRLFVFLDGYDEVSGTDNINLRSELSRIFGSVSTAWTSSAQRESLAAPELLQSSRIWLSSRREFFELNRISLPTISAAGVDTIAAFSLGGVGAKRSQLAKNIFDKYRKRGNAIGDLLSEEYFLTEIDRGMDVDVRELSFRPLFLTVMCYVYIQTVIEQKRHDVALSGGLEELLLSCVRLLLVDLDKEKARDLPAAHRDALLGRRNSYPNEKFEFLKYFASELMLESYGAFTFEELKKAVGEFAESDLFLSHKSPAQKYLMSMEGQVEFATQLIHSGVFTIAATINAERYFDFPHRRFREVMALQYIATPERYWRVLPQIGRVGFQEFLRLLRVSATVQAEMFQLAALNFILTQSIAAPSRTRDVVISKNFFELASPNVDPTYTIQAWLVTAFLQEKPSFDLSAAIVRRCETDTLLNHCLRVLEKGIASNQPSHVALAMRVLEINWEHTASQCLHRYAPLAMLPTGARLPLLVSALRVAPEVALDYLKSAADSRELWFDFCQATLLAVRRDWTTWEELRAYWNECDRIGRVRWAGAVARLDAEAFGEMRRQFAFSWRREWIQVAVEFSDEEARDLASSKSHVYLWTDDGAAEVARTLSQAESAAVSKLARESQGDRNSGSHQGAVTVKMPGPVLECIRAIAPLFQARRIVPVSDWLSAEVQWRVTIARETDAIVKSADEPSLRGAKTQFAAEELFESLFMPIRSALSVAPAMLIELREARSVWSCPVTAVETFFWPDVDRATPKEATNVSPLA